MQAAAQRHVNSIVARVRESSVGVKRKVIENTFTMDEKFPESLQFTSPMLYMIFLVRSNAF